VSLHTKKHLPLLAPFNKITQIRQSTDIFIRIHGMINVYYHPQIYTVINAIYVNYKQK